MTATAVSEQVMHTRRGTAGPAHRPPSRDHPGCQHAGLLEEHVHQLPEHVVDGHVHFLDHARIVERATSRWSTAGRLPSPAAPAGQRDGQQAAAPWPRRDRAARSGRFRRREMPSAMSRARQYDLVGEHRVHAAAAATPVTVATSAVSEIAGSARLPTITGWTNSTATCARRCSPRRCRTPQPAAPVEPHRHRVAGRGDRPRLPGQLTGPARRANAGTLARDGPVRPFPRGFSLISLVGAQVGPPRVDGSRTLSGAEETACRA